MSYLCAICNGLSALSAFCPECGTAADDCGAAADLTGPYAPYRPIDDMRMTNGWTDLEQHVCMHIACCQSCSRTFSVAVPEMVG